MKNPKNEKSQEELFFELGKSIIANRAKKIVGTVREMAEHVLDPNVLTDTLMRHRYRVLRRAGLSHERALSTMKEGLMSGISKEEK